jgi:L-ribulose-5-phosphate 4-epimerase
MHDEGYIKFNAICMGTAVPELTEADPLNKYRRQLYDQKLIGAYPDGIGFGNISRRLGSTATFIISGSATGQIPELKPAHYALVLRADIQNNTVYYVGQTPASSESMSHAVLYEACPEIHAVIHVHHRELWQGLKDQLPTTPAEVRYGSPEMAEAILWLLKGTKLRESGVFISAGHEEGIFAFGETLAQAYERINTLWPVKT